MADEKRQCEWQFHWGRCKEEATEVSPEGRPLCRLHFELLLRNRALYDKNANPSPPWQKRD